MFVTNFHVFNGADDGVVVPVLESLYLQHV